MLLGTIIILSRRTIRNTFTSHSETLKAIRGLDGIMLAINRRNEFNPERPDIMWCININYIQTKIRVELSGDNDELVPLKRKTIWKRIMKCPKLVDHRNLNIRNL